MCGIAGLIDWRGRFGRDEIAAIARRMADAMPYRGPDDHGVWTSPDGRCALSHRRLSIIDTSPGGHQPFVGDGQRHAITFNGEIYNYRELRGDLESRGARFRTQSDTEVLLAMLAQSGMAALEQLDGQFAFGLWMASARELLLARDPFGEKPLYFAEGDGWFAFASELHALAQVPGLDTSVDDDTIAEYLALQYVDAPRTIWRGARKLKPGHWLRLSGDGQVTIGRHFAFRPTGDVRNTVPLPELADELEDILLRLVRRRMISDVPLGAFLSGGVDSSTVVALMTKALGGAVRTFSIGFAGAGDESEHLHARATAEHLGTQHCEQVLELDVLPLLHKIATVLDEPMGDSSCLPTWLVSQVAKQHVTVCLSGDGGDEMFGGYGRYFATLQDEARDCRFDAGFAYYRSRMLIHLDEHLAELFGRVPDRAAALLSSLRRRLSREPGPLLHRMRRHDAEHYMPGAVLAKVDRMSMQHSLEVRTPFLARELAAFAERMPVDALYQHGQGKLVLKELAQRWLPRSWLDRRKMGFGVPTRTGWGKADMVRWLHELVLGGDSKLATWIPRRGREAFVQRMAGEHGFAFYQAWLMLVLELWLRAHPATRAEPDSARPIELRPFDSTLRAEPEAADLALWSRLRDLGGPAVVFCGEELPLWLQHLPAGSVLVAPEALEAPPGVRSVALDWRGTAAPDPAMLFALPEATAVFLGHMATAHADVLGLLQARRTPILHRAGADWSFQAEAVPANGGDRTLLSWRERIAARRFGSASTGIVQHVDRSCWRTVLPPALRARAAAPGARVLVSENGVALPHAGSSVQSIAAFGRGRYGIDGDFLYFATSDDSDPTVNGRDYRVVVRGGNGVPRSLAGSRLGNLANEVRERLLRLLPVAESARTFRLARPFRHDGGVCWLASLRSMRVPRHLLREGWTLAVYEDGRPLPFAYSVHEDIRRLGGGRHSVWDEQIFFSAVDNSDPNTNGRAYTAELVASAGTNDATLAVPASGGNGDARLQPELSEADFEREFAALAHEEGREPALVQGHAVVMVIGALFPGGSERQLCNLAVELDRRGLDVTILALAGLGDASAAHYRTLLAATRVRLVAADRVHRDFALGLDSLDAPRLHLLAGLPAGLRDGVFRLYTHLSVLRPEVLHCSLDLPNIEGGIAGVLADVPRIVLGVRSLNPTHYPNQYRPWFDRYYRVLAQSPRVRLLANSRAGADDYRRWLAAPDLPFHVVYNGLQASSLAWPDDAAVRTFRRGLGIADGALVVGGLLRFSEEKRPTVFVDALARASRELPDLHAVVAGIGPMQTEVEARLREHGLHGRVRLLGRQRDVALVHRAADVVLLTSRIEGNPNAVLEAQWFERPVVATRAGGTAETMVDGETGFLCDVDDSDALGRALVQLLRDPERRARMGKAGRAFVQQRFSLDAMVASTTALYSQTP